MVELVAKTPAGGLLPLTHGGCVLAEVPWQRMTSLIPFEGKRQAVSAALEAAHGLAWPEAGRMTRGSGGECLWSGRGQAFLVGPEPVGLEGLAAMTDQSDGWVTLDLTGVDAARVLARLVPIDLSADFGPQHVARTLLGHVNILLHRVENGFRIRGFRSMAATLVHEIADAMAGVEARGRLD